MEESSEITYKIAKDNPDFAKILSQTLNLSKYISIRKEPASHFLKLLKSIWVKAKYCTNQGVK